ncbi:MAG: cyclic nucleotide-binding domain-containing protein [Deltaproteobacteria bacterium]|nr:cyclic nucleotide-binding domain-containing protein [Deltaproteobacteria bacterium]
MISTVEKVLFLKSVPLFKEIPGEELAQIAQIADEIEFQSDENVFKEGEIGEAMYIVLEGKVRIHRGEKVLTELGERECFGEMSILDSEPRSASVTALKELTALKIQREDFAEILAQKSEIAHGIIKVLTHRLREANKR